MRALLIGYTGMFWLIGWLVGWLVTDRQKWIITTVDAVPTAVSDGAGTTDDHTKIGPYRVGFVIRALITLSSPSKRDSSDSARNE